MSEEATEAHILQKIFWGKYSAIGISVALIVFILDKGHKYYMVEIYHLGDKGRVHWLPFMDLLLSWNKGVSYGMLDWVGASGLAAFAFIAVIGLIGYLAHVENKIAAISVGLIMSGALGNGSDRLHWPGVADYFSFHVGNFEWYIFNIADVAIVAGVIGLIYEAIFIDLKKMK